MTPPHSLLWFELFFAKKSNFRKRSNQESVVCPPDLLFLAVVVIIGGIGYLLYTQLEKINRAEKELLKRV